MKFKTGDRVTFTRNIEQSKVWTFLGINLKKEDSFPIEFPFEYTTIKLTEKQAKRLNNKSFTSTDVEDVGTWGAKIRGNQFSIIQF